MTEKIDLRYKGNNDFPPEIKQLIEKHGGKITAAEKAAGVSASFFARIRKNGKFTDDVKARVVAALNDEPVERPAVAKQNSLDLPETCPPLLIDLLKTKGSKKAAMATLGTSDGMFYAVMRGQREMPEAWTVRAKAALGLPVIGANVPQPAAPAVPSIPEFVPWDGKSKGSYTTRPFGPHKARTIKNVPQPILDFVAKFDGSLPDAARAVGLSSGAALLPWMEPGKFTEQKQRRLHAALHGQAPLASDRNSMGESFDKYETGFAICMMKGTNFDRIAEIADILNGRVVFRKNTTKGWIIIYLIPNVEDLHRFKRLALRDAEEIVCP